MCGATVIDGDIHQQARARVAIAVGILMGRKNVPPSVYDCEAMAAAIVARFDMGQLFMIVHGTPDEDTGNAIDWQANHWLDRDAAINMIGIFARVGGIGKIPEKSFNALVENILAKLKCDNPFRDEFLVWPTPAKVEELAISGLGHARPIDLVELELAMHPVTIPPAPRSRAEAIRRQAWRVVANMISVLMARKNVPPGAVTSEGIAALLVDYMNPEQLGRLAEATPDADTIQQIYMVAENELDWNRGVETIRIFARVANIHKMSDLELIEITGRMIDRLRGSAGENSVSLRWPSLSSVETMAVCRLKPDRSYDLAELEAGLPANRAALEAIVANDGRAD